MVRTTSPVYVICDCRLLQEKSQGVASWCEQLLQSMCYVIVDCCKRRVRVLRPGVNNFSSLCVM